LEERMPFEFTPHALAGVVLIRPRVFRDTRGEFLETYRYSEFEAAGIRGPFRQDNCSVSSRGVLRGIHYQLPPRSQGKLVFVARGSVWDVCVDLRRHSPTFRKSFGITLSEHNHLMLYVPPGFGHGFVVTSDSAHFLYKCTEEYDPAAERGIRWDDPDLAIAWPLREVMVSAKDSGLPRLAHAEVFEAAPP
jgi:dTDP-4-dehydrorhamnose 3,5-epimerase